MDADRTYHDLLLHPLPRDVPVVHSSAQIQPNVPRSFRIPGKILPIVLPLLGWCSIFFAVVLVFIPPAELDMGGYGFYLAKLLGGAVLAIALAEWTYHRAQKRNAANK